MIMSIVWCHRFPVRMIAGTKLILYVVSGLVFKKKIIVLNRLESGCIAWGSLICKDQLYKMMKNQTTVLFLCTALKIVWRTGALKISDSYLFFCKVSETLDWYVVQECSFACSVIGHPSNDRPVRDSCRPWESSNEGLLESLSRELGHC